MDLRACSDNDSAYDGVRSVSLEMKVQLGNVKCTAGWLAFLLPIGIALPQDCFVGFDVIVLVLFYLGLAMPVILYALCLIDGFRTIPKQHWGAWLLIFHFLKVPLFLVGLVVWYGFLFIRGFFSNGVPPQD